MQIENIENLHILSPRSADTGVRCRLHLHQQHKSTNGGKGRKAILHISGDDGAWKGMLFFCGLVIKYVEIGLGVLRQREDFKGRLQAATTLTGSDVLQL